MGEDGGDIDRQRFQAGIKSGELLEKQWGINYASILNNLDRILFRGETGKYQPGWREIDVRIGPYLPPRYQEVPGLINSLGARVGELETQIDPTNTQERKKLGAWMMIELLKIHPKLEGNGRLAKAAGQQFIPSKQLVGHRANNWDAIERLSVEDMMVKIAQSSGKEIPPLIESLNQNYGSHDLKQLEEIMSAFYRSNGRDWSAEILRQEIGKLKVDQGKLISPDLDRNRALMGMTTFIDEAPNNNLVKNQSRLSKWVSILRRNAN